MVGVEFSSTNTLLECLYSDVVGAVRWSIDTADGDGLLVGSEIAPCRFKGIIGCIESRLLLLDSRYS